MHVTLRPLTMDDFDQVVEWSTDDRFCTANGWQTSRDVDELRRWWHRCVSNTSRDFIRMGIECAGRLVGYVDLAAIDGDRAEFGIAIGDSASWGKGIGTLAAQRAVEHAAKMGIAVLDAETHETNVRSRALLQKMGFAEVSRVGTEEYNGVAVRLIQCRLSLSKDP